VLAKENAAVSLIISEFHCSHTLKEKKPEKSMQNPNQKRIRVYSIFSRPPWTGASSHVNGAAIERTLRQRAGSKVEPVVCPVSTTGTQAGEHNTRERRGGAPGLRLPQWWLTWNACSEYGHINMHGFNVNEIGGRGSVGELEKFDWKNLIEKGTGRKNFVWENMAAAGECRVRFETSLLPVPNRVDQE